MITMLRPKSLSLLRMRSAAAQCHAPFEGALQSTWGITRMPTGAFRLPLTRN